MCIIHPIWYRKIRWIQRNDARAQNGCFRVSCAQPTGWRFTANRWYRWKHYRVLVGVTTHQISTTPNGKSQTQKNSFPETHIISPIWRWKICWIQWYDYFSNPMKCGSNIVTELGVWDKGKGIRLIVISIMHHTPVIYNGPHNLGGKLIDVWVVDFDVLNSPTWV